MATALQAEEYKVIIIGALGVGKTSLLLRYVHDTFEDRLSRFVSEEKKTIVVQGKEIVLDIWDTAGTRRMHTHTYTHKHVHVHIHSHTHSHTHTHTCTCTHPYPRTWTHTSTQAHTQAHTHTHMHMYTPIPTHMDAHKHTHKHTHTHTCLHLSVVVASLGFRLHLTQVLVIYISPPHISHPLTHLTPSHTSLFSLQVRRDFSPSQIVSTQTHTQ